MGGDQRVDNKSHDYTVLRLDREPGRGWRILSIESSESKSHQPQNGSSSHSLGDTGDVAFEHQASGTIISLNSVCTEYREASLGDLSRYLLLGLNTRGPVVSEDIEVDGTKALSSTVEAYMSERSPSGSTTGRPTEIPVKVRAVVLRKTGCTYDLMFVARPRYFDELAPTFERFLKEFHAE